MVSYPYSNPRRDMTYIHKNPQDESPLSLPSWSHTLWEGRTHTLSQEGTCQHVEINQLQFVKFWFFLFSCPFLLLWLVVPSLLLCCPFPSHILTCCPSLLLVLVVPPFSDCDLLSLPSFVTCCPSLLSCDLPAAFHWPAAFFSHPLLQFRLSLI